MDGWFTERRDREPGEPTDREPGERLQQSARESEESEEPKAAAELPAQAAESPAAESEWQDSPESQRLCRVQVALHPPDDDLGVRSAYGMNGTAGSSGVYSKLE